MKSVTWYISDLIACGIVRADVPARAINQFTSYRASCKRDTMLSDLFNSDLMVFQRGCRPQDLHHMRQAQARGIRCIYDIDDDMFNVPQHVKDAHAYFSQPETKQLIVDMLLAADLVTVSNEVMLEVVQRYTKRPARIVQNCIDMGHVRAVSAGVKKAGDGTVNIAWHGSMTHVGDISIVQSPLVEILRRHKHVNLHLYGHWTDDVWGWALKEFGARVKYSGWIDPNMLYAELARHDIGLCPLENTPFNRAKSWIKWAEYGSVELPAVVSPLQPYTCVEHGEDAIIAEGNSEASWTDALDALVKDENLRKRIGRGACLKVIRKYDNGIVSKEWSRVFDEALAMT